MEINNRAGHARINARGDCVDLAGAGSGRRSENPQSLAVGSVNNQAAAILAGKMAKSTKVREAVIAKTAE